ncbi:Cyclin C/H/T/L [Niveomyces insectorum RCEF 264]|uniref:RNA polymerase II holoenzyme cyclin-like subunit n=1 Tax=Niveomyces insectorum RCEF 264 TaxID=1081102 RepID=A0A168ADQ2_9HYPO|nr:Cyclin C/H/T/L [Niveomyces insectorum RCEF 264]
MASIERYRPTREGYQPPSLPQARPAAAPAPTGVPLPPNSASTADRRSSQSPSFVRRRDVPPAVPSPPTHSSRTSPPRRPTSSKSMVSFGASSPQRTAHSSYQPPSSQQQQQQQQHYHHQNGHQQPAQPDERPFASQWYYTPEELISTPSVLDGLSPAEERARRAKGVNFIYQSGIAVQPHSLPQVTLYVAAVFFHRFYMRISMVEERGGIHHYKIAATALFLANKTEENCFKTKSLIIAVAKVAQKNPDMIVDEQSKEYWRWRDSILTYEELMLETLTFDLVVANPYDQLWEQLRRLGQLGCKPIREAAWTFLNDAALTALPLLLESSGIAVASIFFASVASNEKIDDVRGQPWWRFLRVDEARITRAIQLMVAFYKENPLKKQTGRFQGSPVFQLETTRRPHELSQLNSSRYLDSGDGGGDNSLSREVTPLELDRPLPLPASQPTQSTQPSQPSQPSQISQPMTTTAATTTAASIATGGAVEEDKIDTDQANNLAVPLAQTASGDSDAMLKAVANDLDHHHHDDDDGGGRGGGRDKRNGYGPSADRKRKSVDLSDDDNDNDDDDKYEERAGRQPKRARPSADETEG